MNLKAPPHSKHVGQGPTGPTTAKGKARAAINAVKHGLAGRGLLLPGEDKAEYESRLDGIFLAMAPQNDAEAELVALVADDIWKLGRLARIEKGITLGRIEELLGLTGTAENAAITANAITALGTALATWASEPMPTERTAEFSRRFHAMADALCLAEDTVTGLPADLLATCTDRLARLHGFKGETHVDRAAYAELFQAARQVMGLLLVRGHGEEAAQDELRTVISGIALPDEVELKKLARYTRMLEDSLQRRLAALGQLRALASADRGTALGEAGVRAREYRLALRVVT